MTDPVAALPGVGPAFLRRLHAAGIQTPFDLLLHAPFRYEDRGRFVPIAEARPGSNITICGVVGKTSASGRFHRVPVLEATVADASGELVAVWYGLRFLGKSIVPGVRVALHGKYDRDAKSRLRLSAPEWEILGDDADDGGIHVGRVVPIYRKLGEGRDAIGGKILRRLMWSAVQAAPDADPLPLELRDERRWPPRRRAWVELHFPESLPSEPRPPARARLVFEELLALRLAAAAARAARPAPSWVMAAQCDLSGALLLPFELTAAQRRTLAEIGTDLAAGRTMARLLQGDVGSGKTVVAALALAAVATDGRQGAFLAPTEVLAEQHAATLAELFDPAGVRWVLVTGALGRAARRVAAERIAAGEVDVAIGTHALLSEDVAFRSLALVVIDEQHRFGVEHREALAAKGAPHRLVMTATPIPRSLALTIYGDLDRSVLDQLPAGRAAVRSFVRPQAARPEVLRFLAERVAQGERGFVVFPFVEESATLSEVRALEAHAEEVAAHLAGVATARVHGRMRREQRELEMARFRDGAAPVLLATSVIEVGIDVPEATVMVIENAERFGLAQLHQLRGRIGRGTRPGWCVFIHGDAADDDARTRLDELARTRDGFAIAELDLRRRGAGEIFGRRQSGRSELRLADPFADLDLMESAVHEADRLAAAGKAEAMAAALAEWRLARGPLAAS